MAEPKSDKADSGNQPSTKTDPGGLPNLPDRSPAAGSDSSRTRPDSGTAANPSRKS